jgi:virulence-associated protein VapD
LQSLPNFTHKGETRPLFLPLLCGVISDFNDASRESLNLTKMKTLKLLLWVTACTLSLSSQASIIYVDKDAAGSNDGSSWTHAYTDLQDALATATFGDEIWLADGIYKPTSTTDRTISFVITSDISIYGGFNGTETQRNDRDWGVNNSILSGGIGSTSDITDNTYNLVFVQGTNVLIDGLELRRAYCDLSDIETISGAIHVSSNSEITVRHCDIRLNTAYTGSAISTYLTSDVIVDNCLIHDNSNFGGAIVSMKYESSLQIYNSTITENNFTETYGTAIGGYITAEAEVYNCIIWNNDGHTAFGSTPVTATRVILDYVDYNPSDILTDILTTDPLFTDATNEDFTLQPSSPAIDFGLNSLSNLYFDFNHDVRIWNGVVDLGCYEYSNSEVIFVNQDATGANTGASWYNAYADLQDALATYTEEKEIWIAGGVYVPTSTSDRTISFNLPANVEIYGGFSGIELLREARDWQINSTILSGKIGSANADDNSYHVLEINNANAVILDGLRIKDGFANGSSPDSHGAAFRIEATDVHLRNCQVSNHYASYCGGVFVDTGSQLYATDCLFSDNTAEATGAILGSAGSYVEISNSEIRDNVVDGSGGGISVFGTYSFYNSEFNNNVGGTTGGCLALTIGSSGTIDNCTFSQNSAATGVGTISMSGLSTNISNCVFNGNSGGSTVGAIDLINGIGHVEGCLFHDNSSNATAALRVNPLATGFIVNCTFTENISNSGTDSCVNLDGNGGEFTNCIVWNNETSIPFEQSASNANPSHCIIQGGATGTDIHDCDPNFIDPSADDFQISSNSPAFNSGLNASSTLATDLNGFTRIYPTKVDMGCYESQSCDPPHDECTEAIALIVNDEAKFGSNQCATNDGDVTSSCTVSTGRTVWYLFEAPESGVVDVITSDVNKFSPQFNMRLTAFSGDCGTLTEIGCINSFSDDSPETITLAGLNPGQTYFVRLDGVGTQEASFLIKVNAGTASYCSGDFNGDGSNDTADLLTILSAFGCQSNCNTDLNDDDSVDTSDLLTFLSLFGSTCL